MAIPHGERSGQPCDLTQLEQLGDCRQLVEIVEMFLTNTPVIIDQLSLSIDKNDWGLVRELAHKGKSSSGLFRAYELTSALVQIETQAKSGKGTDQIRRHLQELISAWLRLEAFLTEEKQKLKEYLS